MRWVLEDLRDMAAALCFGMAAGVVAALIQPESEPLVTAMVTVLVTSGVALVLGRRR